MLAQFDQTNQRLLRALAEELKLPLLQISRQAELSSTPQPGDLHRIEVAANQALWFVDSYLLSQQLLGQASLDLEPITVSSVLEQVAHNLDGLSKQYNCHLEVQLSGRYGPVMAHRRALQAALIGLGSTLITSQTDQSAGAGHLILAAHKTSGGIAAGVFSQTQGLSQSVYRRGKALYGQAAQAMPEFSAQPAASIFMADVLFDSMHSRLRVAQHSKMTGLAATLRSSQQLALV